MSTNGVFDVKRREGEGAKEYRERAAQVVFEALATAGVKIAKEPEEMSEGEMRMANAYVQAGRCVLDIVHGWRGKGTNDPRFWNKAVRKGGQIMQEIKKGGG